MCATVWDLGTLVPCYRLRRFLSVLTTCSEFYWKPGCLSWFKPPLLLLISVREVCTKATRSLLTMALHSSLLGLMRSGFRMAGSTVFSFFCWWYWIKPCCFKGILASVWGMSFLCMVRGEAPELGPRQSGTRIHGVLTGEYSGKKWICSLWSRAGCQGCCWKVKENVGLDNLGVIKHVRNNDCLLRNELSCCRLLVINQVSIWQKPSTVG